MQEVSLSFQLRFAVLVAVHVVLQGWYRFCFVLFFDLRNLWKTEAPFPGLDSLSRVAFWAKVLESLGVSC